jgi:hypothetical protein
MGIDGRVTPLPPAFSRLFCSFGLLLSQDCIGQPHLFFSSSNETRIHFFHEGADDYKCNKVERGGANSPVNWKVSKWIGVYDVDRNQ